MHKTHSRACYPAAGGLDFGMRMVRTISRSVSCRSRGGRAPPAPPRAPPPGPVLVGLSVQPTTYYNEGEQPTYTVTDGNNLNMRGGPGTDYDKIGQVPASTGVTALGTNEDGSWVVVNYNGTYGWLKTEFLNG